MQKLTSFPDKNSQNIGYRKTIPQHNEGHIWPTHSLHHTQGWKDESFLRKNPGNTVVHTLTILIQHSTGSPN